MCFLEKLQRLLVKFEKLKNKEKQMSKHYILYFTSLVYLRCSIFFLFTSYRWYFKTP